MLKKLLEIIEEKKNDRRWRRVFISSVFVVIFLTIYALTLPAITLDTEKAVDQNIVPGQIEDTIQVSESETTEVTSPAESKPQREQIIEFDLAEQTTIQESKSSPSQGPEQVTSKTQEVTEPQKSNVKQDLNFKDESGKTKTEVKIDNSEVAEDAVLKVETLAADQADLLRKKAQIEAKIEGEIKEIIFYDISFFEQAGDYIQMDETAAVSLDTEAEKLTVEAIDEITVFHFEDDGPTELATEVSLNQDQELEEVNFETDGFSVFAVVKHSTWTEARIDSDPYYLKTDIDANNSQYLYFDTDDTLKHQADWTDTGLHLHQIAGNNYYISNLARNKYLAINNNNISIVNSEANATKFKLYNHSTEPHTGKVMIQVADSNGTPQIFAYNKTSEEYEIVNSYEKTEPSIIYHEFIPHDPEYIDDFTQPDLIDAIIPDGAYEIRDSYGNYNLANTYSISGDPDAAHILFRQTFNFQRQADGRYLITSTFNNNYYLRIGNNKPVGGYYGVVVCRDYQGLDAAQLDGKYIRIAALKTHPDLFYIYNDYGSLQWYKSGISVHKFGSRAPSMGNPLRIYKNGQSFNHLESQPTEILADIRDGNYVIGKANYPPDWNDPNNTESPENLANPSRMDLNALNFNGSAIENQAGYIHVNEKATNDNNEYHTIESIGNIDPTQWTFSQTDRPGYYTITSGNQYLKFDGVQVELSTNPQEIRISKPNDRVDQIMLIHGGNRLRYVGTGWSAVPNSIALTDADYHYIGKLIDDDIHFELTNPELENGNNWLNNVRLMKAMKLSDLKGSLEANIPKGNANARGPIGRKYALQNQGQLTTPFDNLYRMALADLEQGQSNPPDHFKEFAFLGWEYTQDGTVYIIDGDADFTENATQQGITIDKQYVKKSDGSPSDVDVFIPYGNSENPLKTKWRELSAPLYFYFNHGSGIMDLERAISVDELLERESNANHLSGTVARGRLFYGQDINDVINNATTSSITANANLQNRFKSRFSLNLTADNLINLDEKYLNQIFIETSPGDVTAGQTITQNKLKEDSINWLNTENKILSILKKSIDGTEDIYYKIAPANVKIENYNIDFLNLDNKANGVFLQGIAYGEMINLSIDKQFTNLTLEQVNAIKDLHSTGIPNSEQEKYTITIEDDDNSDTLYKLTFDNPQTQSAYPQVGDSPKTYDAIERVSNNFNQTDLSVQWQARVFKDEKYKLVESGMGMDSSLTDGKKMNFYSKIIPVRTDGVNVEPQLDVFSYATPKMKTLETDIINTGEVDHVLFYNLYSSEGMVILTKTDQDGMLLKGIEFELYRKEGENETLVDKLITRPDGTLVFTDLPGKKLNSTEKVTYVLKEVENQDSIYKSLPDFTFSIEEIHGDKRNVHSIYDFTNNQYYTAKAGNFNDGDRGFNFIDVTNTIDDIPLLMIEKQFEGITFAEFDAIALSDGADTFYIELIAKNDGVQYTEILNYNNANFVGRDKSMKWYIETFDDGAGGTILFNEMDEIVVNEYNPEIEKYPVIKRNATINEVAINPLDYPYIIKNDQFVGAGQTAFHLTNTYTDVFDLALQIEGRSKNFNDYIPLEGIKFKLYGDLDEGGDPNKPKDINGTTLYQLEKEHQNIAATGHTGYYSTNNQGIDIIYNLSFYPDNQYALDQIYDPNSGKDQTYYPLENPFIVEIVNQGGKLTPSLKMKIGEEYKDLTKEEVKTEMGVFRATYQNELMILRLQLDRTNYRLPETGGIGREVINKVAVITIVAASTLLIYRRKKHLTKLQRRGKNEKI